MGVEEVLFPLRPVLAVRCLGIQAHDSRKNLSHEDDHEPGIEHRVGTVVTRFLRSLLGRGP